jgi:hypothetical protein
VVESRKRIKGIEYTYYKPEGGKEVYVGRADNRSTRAKVTELRRDDLKDQISRRQRELESLNGSYAERFKFRDKLKFMDSERPYFFPVWDGGLYNWHSFLISYGSISVIARSGFPFDRSQTLIMVESGGLSEATPKDQASLLTEQSEIHPDIVFTLDKQMFKPKGKTDLAHELAYHSVSANERRRITRENMDNVRLAMKMKKEHGLDFELLVPVQAMSLSDEVRLLKVLSSMEIDMFGIHGRFTGGMKEGRDVPFKTEVFQQARDAVGPKAWIHALGITDVRILRPIRDLIDSFDSKSLIDMMVQRDVYNRGKQYPGRKYSVKFLGEGGKEADISPDYASHVTRQLSFLEFTEHLKKCVWESTHS